MSKVEQQNITRDCIWGSVMIEEQYDSPESKEMWAKFEESIGNIHDYNRRQARLSSLLFAAQMFGIWLVIMSSIALLIILFR